MPETESSVVRASLRKSLLIPFICLFTACVTLYSKLNVLQAFCLLLFACCVAVCIALYIVSCVMQALFAIIFVVSVLASALRVVLYACACAV